MHNHQPPHAAVLHYSSRTPYPGICRSAQPLARSLTLSCRALPAHVDSQMATGLPAATIGLLETNAGNCSASAVNSNSKRLVITAAHCVHEGNWVTSAMFIPKFSYDKAHNKRIEPYDKF